MLMLNKLVRLLFPKVCLNCYAYTDNHNNNDISLCQGCQQELPVINNPCYRCALPISSASFQAKANSKLICGACQSNPPYYDRMLVCGPYQTPYSDFISNLKFQQQLIYAPLLGKLLLQQIPDDIKTDKGLDCIIPVPLHNRRLRQRGFNQALELAKLISTKLAIPIDKSLIIRQRQTDAQAQLKFSSRQCNIAQAFKLKPGTNLPQRVLLIDDVITTGATINELAKTLKNGGVKHITALGICRTLQH